MEMRRENQQMAWTTIHHLPRECRLCRDTPTGCGTVRPKSLIPAPSYLDGCAICLPSDGDPKIPDPPGGGSASTTDLNDPDYSTPSTSTTPTSSTNSSSSTTSITETIFAILDSFQSLDYDAVLSVGQMILGTQEPRSCMTPVASLTWAGTPCANDDILSS